MATLMTTADLVIDYAPTPSGFDYRVSLDGLWVASATTFHAGALVADEVQYNTFLANDPPTCSTCQTYLETDGTCRFCAMVERMHDTTVRPPTDRYVRHSACDRRFARGDDFAADAWRDTHTGAIRFVAVGHIPIEPDPDDGPGEDTDGVPSE